MEEVIDELRLSSFINMCLARDVLYMYNHSYPRVIIYCYLWNGSYKWGRVQRSVANDENMVMHRFMFTRSQVGIYDL